MAVDRNLGADASEFLASLERETLGETSPLARDKIRWMQTALARVGGARLAIDGIWGPRTAAALRAFQAQRGLPADAVFSPATEAVLRAAFAASGAAAAVSGLVRFNALAGVPTHYARKPVAPYGTRGKPRYLRCLPGFRQTLDAAFADLWRICPLGKADTIVTAGAYVDKPGRGEHSKGKAFDLDALFWPSYSFVTKEFARDPAFYLGVEGVLRRHFGVVLGYFYNKAHQDHFHLDVSMPMGFSRNRRTTTLFVQLCGRHLLGRASPVTGKWNRSADDQTLADLQRLVGHAGDLTRLENWRDFLERIAARAFAGSAARAQPGARQVAFELPNELSYDEIPLEEVLSDEVTSGAAPSPAALPAPPLPPGAAAIRVLPVRPRQVDSLEPGVRAGGSARFRPAGDPRDLVLAATAAAEGGYDTVNMYDRGILSWGIMQWTVHMGSLQGALAFILAGLRQRGQAALWGSSFRASTSPAAAIGRFWSIAACRCAIRPPCAGRCAAPPSVAATMRGRSPGHGSSPTPAATP